MNAKKAKSAQLPKAKPTAEQTVSRRTTSSAAKIEDRVILMPSLKPRHLTMRQIRAMVEKVTYTTVKTEY